MPRLGEALCCLAGGGSVKLTCCRSAVRLWVCTPCKGFPADTRCASGSRPLRDNFLVSAALVRN